MNRTYHHHVSPLNWAAVVFVAAAALCFLWNRSAGGAVVGFLLVITGMMMIERMIHTAYTFTDDGALSISRGRFSCRLDIPLNEITMARSVRMRLLPVRYVLIEYGPGRLTSAQPGDEQGFISELRRRQKAADKKLFDNEED